MAAAIAANSARHVVLVIPAPLGSTHPGYDSYHQCTLMFPVRDFEHEDWTTLVRGKPLALIESRHVGMHCIESRIVANAA
eukprot:501443-Pelagomonas_calceolata.AAC.1